MTNLEMDVAHSTVRANKAVASHYENIDWEQRRYEIAKDVLAARIARSDIGFPTPNVIAKRAIEYADALIEKLKEE